jgi:hypothetical protein
MNITITPSAPEILAKALSAYINGAYIEFQQGNSPVTDLPEPTDEAYYRLLRQNTLGNRDFLRAGNVIAHYTGKQLVFQALVAGTHGEGGHEAENSRIYGAALIYMPTKDGSIDDITRDIVFARGYFQPDEQLVITSSEQQVITFTLNL